MVAKADNMSFWYKSFNNFDLKDSRELLATDLLKKNLIFKSFNLLKKN